MAEVISLREGDLSAEEFVMLQKKLYPKGLVEQFQENFRALRNARVEIIHSIQRIKNKQQRQSAQQTVKNLTYTIDSLERNVHMFVYNYGLKGNTVVEKACNSIGNLLQIVSSCIVRLNRDSLIQDAFLPLTAMRDKLLNYRDALTSPEQIRSLIHSIKLNEEARKQEEINQARKNKSEEINHTVNGNKITIQAIQDSLQRSIDVNISKFELAIASILVRHLDHRFFESEIREITARLSHGLQTLPAQIISMYPAEKIITETEFNNKFFPRLLVMIISIVAEAIDGSIKRKIGSEEKFDIFLQSLSVFLAKYVLRVFINAGLIMSIDHVDQWTEQVEKLLSRSPWDRGIGELSEEQEKKIQYRILEARLSKYKEDTRISQEEIFLCTGKTVSKEDVDYYNAYEYKRNIAMLDAVMCDAKKCRDDDGNVDLRLVFRKLWMKAPEYVSHAAKANIRGKEDLPQMIHTFRIFLESLYRELADDDF